MANKPTHDLTMITGEGKSAVFTRVAPVWPTKDGTGFTGEIPDGITVTGRFAVLLRKEKDEQPD